MSPEIEKFIESLPPEWTAIKQQAVKYFDADSVLEEDGIAKIFRMPWIAPQCFGLVLYPPAKQEWINKFEEQTGISVPLLYKQVLLKMNGGFIYGLSLYGLPETMYETGLLNRSYLQPLYLGSANTGWIYEYKVDKALFHIGGRSYSDSENIGYFVDGNKIYAIRKNGEVLDSWASFEEFLNKEILLAEQRMLQQKASKSE